MVAELPELLLPDAAAWRRWLAENHSTSPGIRLVLHKKGSTVTALTYAAALDEALCFGWIDGVIGRRDEGSYLTRFTPRRRGSVWSQNNVLNVARLQADGRMHTAGEAAVAAARADGCWERAYAGQGSAEVQADLAAAIAAEPQAQAMFEVLTASNRYALIYRVNAVKSEAARTRKINGLVQMLARGETPFPQKRMPN
ncbi:YdeI/OmpD-associated family protein [Arthrobacter sp. A5]|uniref:YdeI/OmpD-associated family protein n=1 Tax=Arthrobacter sp. A5 TaxID=576926 RepID=UPI003DAA3333